jgi:hypothetical protein
MAPNAQVRGFWHQLETATNERQRALLHRLNAHLEGLSRAIEVQSVHLPKSCPEKHWCLILRPAWSMHLQL